MAGRQVELVRTFEIAASVDGNQSGPWGWWALSRYRALVDAFRVVAGVPITLAHFVSGAVLVLAVKEVGWTVREWNYNPWNLHQGSYDGDWVIRDDAAHPTRFRAFHTLQESAENAVHVLAQSQTYGVAWAALVRGDVTIAEWYEMILRAGYGPATAANIREYADLVELVRTRYTAYTERRS